MPDKPPLLFRRAFGALRPANSVTEAALAAYSDTDTLRVRITRASGNTRRNSLYWVVLGIAVENLDERVPGLTVDALHRKLKRELDLAKPIVSAKTGEIIDFDYESIAFDAMPEHERSEYVNAAFKLLAHWLGCTVEELTQEGMAA